jgi:hypothetical protein
MNANNEGFGGEAMIGQRVTIRGTAGNAKAGAVVLTDVKEVIYVRNRQEWPDDLIGKHLEVVGVLSKERIYHEATINEGAISQGISGAQLVIDVESLRSL